jgi:hypothetical protein
LPALALRAGSVDHDIAVLDDVRERCFVSRKCGDVVDGAHDPVTPIEDSEDMVERLDPSIVTLVPVDNAGHGVWHDDPERAFALLRDFITRE